MEVGEIRRGLIYMHGGYIIILGTKEVRVTEYRSLVGEKAHKKIRGHRPKGHDRDRRNDDK